MLRWRHVFRLAGAMLVVLGLGPRHAAAFPGELDASFGFAGAVVTQPPPDHQGMGITAIAVAPDGAILAAGWPNRLVRYLPAGRIDEAFGENGVAHVPPVSPLEVVLQDGGGILVARESGITRLTARGELDATFGTAGTVRPPAPPAVCDPSIYSGIESPGLYPFSRFSVEGLAARADGKVVVAGTLRATALALNTWTCSQKLALLRLLPDGTLDRRFGRHGLAVAEVGAQWGSASAVALDRGGRIVVAGTACEVEGVGGGGHTFSTSCAPGVRSIVVRFSPDGVQDRRFAIAGVGESTRTSTAWISVARLAIAADGSIVTLSTSVDDDVVARLDRRGLPDRRFGVEGQVRVPVVRGFDLTLDRRGRVLVAGDLAGWFGVVRFRSDGALDGGFGYGGFVATMAGGSAYALALQDDGRIVVAGGRDQREDALVRLVGGP